MSEEERTLVLVVDDDEFVRKSLGRNLRRLGCEVLLATDGEQAIRMAVDAKPEVIFLDLRMPGMDGHTVLRRLSTMGLTAGVVVMSGQGDIDDVIEAVRMGAVDYMKKPWTTNDLVSVLARGTEVSRAMEDSEVRASESAYFAKGVDARTGGGPPGAGRIGWMPGASPPPTSGDPAGVSPLVEIVNWLRSGDIPMPPSSTTISRLRDWARAPEAPMEDVASLVEHDRDLAMTVLRLANSALHARSTPVPDVRSAVFRLGLRQVHGLAETLGLRQCYHFRAPAPRAVQERIWRFSVARGLAMRAIADVTGPQIGLDGDQCYLAGLMLDVGASFLLWALEGRKPTDETGGKAEALAPSTVAAIASYHAAFGQAIVTRWGLVDVAALVGEHHGETSPVVGSALWCAAVSAGPLARRLVGADDPTSAHLPRPELLDRCAYALGLGETVLRKLAKALGDDAREIWTVYA